MTRLDLLDPLDVARLGGIEVTTEGVVEGFLTGLHRSPRRGFSVEFAEHRMYQPGDELRYVDWKILGRNDRLYVKQYEEETNLRAMVVCDVSRSMAWTGDPETVLPKLAYAQRLIAALTLILLRQRDATGLIAFDDEVRTVLPPRRAAQPLAPAGEHPRRAPGRAGDRRRARAAAGGEPAPPPGTGGLRLRPAARPHARAQGFALPPPPRAPGARAPHHGSRRADPGRTGGGALRGSGDPQRRGAAPPRLGRGVPRDGPRRRGRVAPRLPPPRHPLPSGHDRHAVRGRCCARPWRRTRGQDDRLPSPLGAARSRGGGHPGPASPAGAERAADRRLSRGPLPDRHHPRAPAPAQAPESAAPPPPHPARHRPRARRRRPHAAAPRRSRPRAERTGADRGQLAEQRRGGRWLAPAGRPAG